MVVQYGDVTIKLGNPIFDLGAMSPAAVLHYSDVIMSAMAFQITGLTIVYSTVYSGADQRKHRSSASLAFVQGIQRCSGEFPAQMASNAENVSIWWRHRDVQGLPGLSYLQW